MWAWFSAKGGQLGDRQFLLFTAGMLLGQIAASVETYLSGAWGTFIIQVYFFAFTAIGGINRMRSMHASNTGRVAAELQVAPANGQVSSRAGVS